MRPDLGVTPADIILDMDYYEKTVGVIKLAKGRNHKVSQAFSFPKGMKDAGKYIVFVGVEHIMDFIEQIIDKDNPYEDRIDWLERTSGGDMSEEFLDYLKNWKPKVDILSVPEGTPVFPKEHALTMTGSNIDVQMLETAVIRFCVSQSAKATMASMIRHLVKKDALLEFGARRSDYPVLSSRASYIGGFDATSYERAGYLYGIPYTGTMSHAYIQDYEEPNLSFSESELRAFSDWASLYPHNCILLVDTYNVTNGITNSIIIGRYLRLSKHELKGIRLDSGDMVAQSKIARQMLDSAGFPGAKIYLSGDISTRRIIEYQNRGVKVRGWGVGTALVQSHINGRFKLCMTRGHPTMKFADWKKASIPGIIQIYRHYGNRGQYLKDVLEMDYAVEGVGIKVDLMIRGIRIRSKPSEQDIRSYSMKEVRNIRQQFKRIDEDETIKYPEYHVEFGPKLHECIDGLVSKWQAEFPKAQRSVLDTWKETEIEIIDQVERIMEMSNDPEKMFGRVKRDEEE